MCFTDVHYFTLRCPVVTYHKNFATTSILAVCFSVLERMSVMATFNYGCETIGESLTLRGPLWSSLIDITTFIFLLMSSLKLVNKANTGASWLIIFTTYVLHKRHRGTKWHTTQARRASFSPLVFFRSAYIVKIKARARVVFDASGQNTPKIRNVRTLEDIARASQEDRGVVKFLWVLGD